MEMNAEFVKDHTQYSDGKQEPKEDLKEQKFVKHAQKLKTFVKLVFLICNMGYQFRSEINF